ncbi:MAG: alpha/beta hydrolase [Proteobacteria bacterium]|nr:alpha/beta hydrolase [Pseudomonadota bacterium]
MNHLPAADGTRLYVEAHGEGPVVLFSCGYCTTHENWRPQVEPLCRAGWRVVLWDFRGHGASGAPLEASAYSMDHVVDDLGRVLDWASPEAPAVLAGLSFGGLASLHFARAHASRVRALALIDTGPGFKNPEAAARWQSRVEHTGNVITTRGVERLVAGKGAATSIGRRTELPAAQAAAAAITAQNAEALALFGRYVAGPAPPVIDDLPAIACPALVLVGEEDAAYRQAAEVMAAKLPQAEHSVVPGAGHVVNLEAEAEFNRRLLQFLSKLPGAPGRP